MVAAPVVSVQGQQVDKTKVDLSQLMVVLTGDQTEGLSSWESSYVPKEILTWEPYKKGPRWLWSEWEAWIH